MIDSSSARTCCLVPLTKQQNVVSIERSPANRDSIERRERNDSLEYICRRNEGLTFLGYALLTLEVQASRQAISSSPSSELGACFKVVDIHTLLGILLLFTRKGKWEIWEHHTPPATPRRIGKQERKRK